MMEKKLNFKKAFMKKSKFIFVFCSIMFALISCNKKQNISIDDKFILLISKDSEPSLFRGISFYCKGENNKIIKIESRDLRMLYNKGIFNMNYLSFLRKVLNQQIALHSKRGVYEFNIDENINKEYQSRKFSDFIHLYCKGIGTDEYVLKKGFTENQRNSIFYFLFINNYLSVFDDYSGSYNIFSTSKYSKYYVIEK